MMKSNNADNLRQIIYHPPGQPYDLYVDVYEMFPQKLTGLIESKRKVLLAYDSHLSSDYISQIYVMIDKSKTKVESLTIPYGRKELNLIKHIWLKMISYHPDLVIGLGGGVICDLVGFSASCYHRGLDHIFIPTTLLSAIDASIGGKTGIDFAGVKNSIGSIHYARHVYILLPFLKSVATRELFSGLAEAIKAGMLFDKNVIKWLNSLHVSSYEASSKWADIIFRSAELKANFAQKPMKDRSKLLYGHNIGHAIETYSTKHVRHGDAVAIGMHLEGALGVILGIMPKNIWLEQADLIKSYKLPYHLPSYVQKNKLVEKMKQYKLFEAGKFLFVIPTKPGKIHEDASGYYIRVSETDFNRHFNNLIKLSQSI